MNNDELLEFNKNRKICQICLVTSDIKNTLKEWVEKLKVGPWKVITLSDETITDATLNGKKIEKPYKYYCAIAMFGNIQIEIIQPCYGITIYDEFLKKTGGGIHHFKENISDEKIPDMLNELDNVGVHPTFRGRINEDIFVNLDTKKYLGFTLELGNSADITLPEEICYTYPENRNGG